VTPAERDARIQAVAQFGECTYTGCREQATKVVEYPASVNDMKPLRNPFCEGHAASIVANGRAFPGARDVTAELWGSR
jgi:hypothetical protein